MLLTLKSILTAGYLLSSAVTADLLRGPAVPEDLVGSKRAVTFSDPTCQAIQAVISNASNIYAPGSQHYGKDISKSHRTFWSSNDTFDALELCIDSCYRCDCPEHYCSSGDVWSRCSVEPGTVNDLAAIVRRAHLLLSVSRSRVHVDQISIYCCIHRLRCWVTAAQPLL